MASTFFETQPLVIGENEWTSLYIPVIPPDLVIVNTGVGVRIDNENTMKWFIEQRLQLGSVSRVDFYKRKSEGGVLSAFVHFNHWYQQSAQLRENINTNGEFRLALDDMRSIHNEYSHRFITLKENKTPIPAVIEVPKNISQIVHDNSVMEQRIAELEAKNAELTQRVSELEEELYSDMPDLMVIESDDDEEPMQISELA
jgi:hypothetical protein